ncbi:hypothetical protein TNCV_117601 [Trichonephila clavipes]|nr:hypothetical protein TNCV_117601 [Trichonephila clavipes]
MATSKQKAFCVLQFAKTESAKNVQRTFRINFGCQHLKDNNILRSQVGTYKGLRTWHQSGLGAPREAGVGGVYVTTLIHTKIVENGEYVANQMRKAKIQGRNREQLGSPEKVRFWASELDVTMSRYLVSVRLWAPLESKTPQCGCIRYATAKVSD